MKQFKGKVAVVTGAASGIGRALSSRFASEGMFVVLADIDAAALAETERELAREGAEVMRVVTDVAKGEDVDALAKETIKAFGAVHVVCNNAGVGSPVGPIWETDSAIWDWTFGVNVWGVLHGIRAFVPLMLQQGGEGHILNTASINGFVPAPLLGIYSATKHAVIAISESLSAELAMNSSELKVSALCPGAVETRIANWERYQSGNTGNPHGIAFTEQLTGSRVRTEKTFVSPKVVADVAFNAIRDEKLFVFIDAGYKQLLRSHLEEITADGGIKRTESRMERLMRMRQSIGRATPSATPNKTEIS